MPLLFSFCLLAGWASSARSDEPVSFTAKERATILSLSPIPPTARDTTNAFDGKEAAIQYGKVLFFDKRLSFDGKQSCATCHDPNTGWTDHRPIAVGAQLGVRNTPSLWNVAQQRWFFWDGRADSLWSQALKPIENNREMNMSRLEVIHTLVANADLRSGYQRLFGPLPDLSSHDRFPVAAGPLAEDSERQDKWWAMDPDDRDVVNRIFSNVGKAIAAFEATIRTGVAPFDRYVSDLRAGKTDSAAISPAAQRGLKTFLGKGSCVVCHSGPLFSNKEFHDIRVPPLTADLPHDEGRYDGVEKIEADEFIAAGPYSDDPNGKRAQQLYFLSNQPIFHGQFKTPSLRNVATSAPYMHQGQFQTLREAVRYYSTLENAVDPNHTSHTENLIVQLNLTDAEIDELVAFLETLTSEPLNTTAQTTDH